jgi:hypothetical protein
MIAADKSTFLPDRTLDEDINALPAFKAVAGVLTVSQTPREENGLRLRVRIQRRDFWARKIRTISRYHHGKPRVRQPRPTEYLDPRKSDAHPGHLRATSSVRNIYAGAIGIRRHIDGVPMKSSE